MSQPTTSQLSALFRAGDDRWLDELLELQDDRLLAPIANELGSDERPWARRMLLGYIDDGCDRPGHRPLVKRLFKRCERAGDDEAMAHFLVAFDHLVEHSLVEKTIWDRQHQCWRDIKSPVLRRDRMAQRFDPQRGRLVRQTFSALTRSYLRRRVVRYFRRLGAADRDRFRAALLLALRLYRDEHLRRPEQIIDAWGLLSVLFHQSPVIERGPRGARITRGRQLSELEPAPMHPAAWHGAVDDLLELAVEADALVVRRFAIGWLERAGELHGVHAARLRPLLESEHPEVRLFAAGQLDRARGLESLSIDQWLDLLTIDDPTVVPTICRLVERHVSPDRLSLAQCLELARARPVPVARLGLAWAQQKPRTAGDLEFLIVLRDAEAATVRAEAVSWVIEQIGELGGRPTLVRELLDARFPDVRALAFALLEADERYGLSTALWAALAESPYGDARDFLVRHLDARREALDREELLWLWASTLLDVRRGSRAKRRALRQVADRAIAEPERSAELLPLLAISLRSVREPERRAALGAIARAAFRCQRLRQGIARHLPEIELFPSDEAAA